MAQRGGFDALPPLRYQPSIDGLRAVAVLAVVGNHLQLPGFGGGFIGVDVFFVISGYLITWLLLDEQCSGREAILWRFYQRRVRRLLPAFVVMIVATVGVACLVLQPVLREPQMVADTAAASAGLYANIFLESVSHGYFETAADQLPLLHTWTLSVEEQFYLVWPMVVLLVVRSRPHTSRRLRAALMAVVLLSFAAEVAMTYRGHYRAAFFQMPLRAWEFAIGGLLLLTPTERSISERTRGVIGWLGLGSLFAAIILLSADDVWPGLLAVIPVAATAALIVGVAGSQSERPVARLLRSHPMLWVGLRSYSLYLWHFPLFGLAHARFGPELGLAGNAILVVIALALSDLSYRFIERPIRREWAPTASAGRVVAIGVLALVLVGVGARTVRGSLDRTHPTDAVSRAFDDGPANAEACMDATVERQLTMCWPRHPASRRLIVLWGDSFANMWQPAIEDYIDRSGGDVGLLVLTRSSCHPFLAPAPSDADDPCVRYNARAIAVIDSLSSAGTDVRVIVGGQWTSFLKTSSRPELLRRAHAEPDTAAMRLRFTESLRRLTRVAPRVLVMATTPVFRSRAPQCLLQWRLPAEQCGESRAGALASRQPATDLIADVTARASNARVHDLFPDLCGPSRCDVMRDGVILMRDRGHLSRSGVRLIGVGARTSFDWLLEDAHSGRAPMAR